MFDSHAHYDDEKFDEDRDSVIEETVRQGVTHIVNPATSVESARACIALAEKHPTLYAAVGVHPHDASTCDGDTLALLEELSKHPKAVAIGEIGLDYHYDFSPRSVQKEWFAHQLQLAKKVKLPVIVHDRESHRDVLDMIIQEKTSETGGVFHCYSGSREMAREILNLGFYIGFCGPVTFRNASKILDVVSYVPLDRILIETDSPYMTPEPFRGKRNWSGLLKYTASKIAEVRGISLEEVEQATCVNAMRLFSRLNGF
jgi:TatD DNase family protein